MAQGPGRTLKLPLDSSEVSLSGPFCYGRKRTLHGMKIKLQGKKADLQKLRFVLCCQRPEAERRSSMPNTSECQDYPRCQHTQVRAFPAGLADRSTMSRIAPSDSALAWTGPVRLLPLPYHPFTSPPVQNLYGLPVDSPIDGDLDSLHAGRPLRLWRA